jgi:8-oxo-dGTP diphosphatase
MGDAGIAAAVVTHSGQVLLIRRAAEGTLSWQFPAGKTEPGESTEDAAVREAAEETGVAVAALRVLGERIHPGTGAHITYVACELVAGTARSGSSREVAEVRWASPQEADDLTAGTIYGPVRRYLREAGQALGGCRRSATCCASPLPPRRRISHMVTKAANTPCIPRTFRGTGTYPGVVGDTIKRMACLPEGWLQ